MKAISNALNDGDIPRAQIATVLLGIPDLPPLVKNARSREAMIQFIRDLYWSGLIKRDWAPDKHPRWPAGAPNSQGGEFAPKDFWQSLVDDVSHEAESLFSEIGSDKIKETNAELSAGAAETNAIATGLKDYANYRAQPWLDSTGYPVQVPVIDEADPIAYRAALAGHFIFEPNAPLMRPATNADWIDPVIGAGSWARWLPVRLWKRRGPEPLLLPTRRSWRPIRRS